MHGPIQIIKCALYDFAKKIFYKCELPQVAQ